MTHNPIQAAEVQWYLKYGRYPERRIRYDGNRETYVIGDWSWNHLGNRPVEIIEPEMRQVICAVIDGALASKRDTP